MKLNGIYIGSIDAFKEHFDLEEVWGNIGNGVLLACQEDFARQNIETAKKIAEILKSYGEAEILEAKISACFADGEWKQAGLEGMLEPLSGKSKDHNGDIFYTRNVKGIQNILRNSVWNVESAALFCVFLYLMLQVKPMEVISAKELAFIQKKLHGAAERMKNTVKTRGDTRIYSCRPGILYLRNGKICNPQNELFSPPEEKISCFAYTEDLGILAFTEQGKVSSCTHPNRKYEMEEKLKEKCGGGKKVSMVAAYGKIYLLLMDDGDVLTNVQDSMTGWRDIRWVGAGLNSITAVKGNNRNLLQIGADDSLNNLSGVKAAYTRSMEGIFRYAVLKEDGSLIMDDGGQERGVSAANISQEGYIYAIGSEIFLRDFEMEITKKLKLEKDGTVVEVCRFGPRVYCRADFAGKEEIECMSMQGG